MTAAAIHAPIRTEIPVETGIRILASFNDGGVDALSEYAHCLVPLLNALGWRGDHRHVAEAVPHFSDNLDLEGLRSVLANLNFALHEVRIRQDRLHPSMLPCIFVPDTARRWSGCAGRAASSAPAAARRRPGRPFDR